MKISVTTIHDVPDDFFERYLFDVIGNFTPIDQTILSKKMQTTEHMGRVTTPGGKEYEIPLTTIIEIGSEQ